MKTLAHCGAVNYVSLSSYKSTVVIEFLGKPAGCINRKMPSLPPAYLLTQVYYSHPKKDLNKQNQANNLPASTSRNNGSPVGTSPWVVSPLFVEVVASEKENKERNKVCDLRKYMM